MKNVLIGVLLVIVIVLGYLQFRPKTTVTSTKLSPLSSEQTTPVNTVQPKASTSPAEKTYPLTAVSVSTTENQDSRYASAIAKAKTQAPNFAGHYVVFTVSAMSWITPYLYDKNTDTTYSFPNELFDGTYDDGVLKNYSVSSNTFTIQKYDANNVSYTEKWELTATGIRKL